MEIKCYVGDSVLRGIFLRSSERTVIQLIHQKGHSYTNESVTAQYTSTCAVHILTGLTG